jgi:type I restriction enzyme S subunit
MPPRMATVGSVLKGIVAGKSVQTLERPPLANELGILKVSAVTWGEFRPSECKAMPIDYEPGDCPRPMDGDILISRANTRELVGAPVMVCGDHPQLLLSDKLLKLIPDETVVDRRYLLRALRSTSAMAHFYRRAGGSTGSMTNITQSDIRDAAIHLPTLAEQRRIATILDLADEIRTLRRKLLAQLDRLAQATFVEMFGNPTTNPRAWPVKRFGEVLACPLRNGRSPSTNGTVSAKVLTLSAITGNAFDASALKTSPFAERPSPNQAVDSRDFLICRGNGNLRLVGRGHFPSNSMPDVTFPDTMIAAQASEDAVAPYFLEHLWASGAVRRQIESLAQTTNGTYKVYQAMLERIKLVMPPVRLQRTFARRIGRIEAVKRLQRAAIQNADMLFSSLQSRAFSGGL